jgi:transcriptional regulator with XRE-family HTH domain
MTLGERVRAARRAQGMSGAALAEASGLTKGFISQFERGLSNPSLESLRRIASTLNVSITGLLAEDSGAGELPVGADQGPTLMPQSDWKEKREGTFPVAAGPVGQVVAKVPPGAWLAHSAEHSGRRTGRMSLFVVHGQARFTQGTTDLMLETGDSLAWNAAGEWRAENPGATTASLLVTGEGAERLQVGEQSRSQARRAGANPPAYDAGGPLRLVAMRAQRQERKGG